MSGHSIHTETIELSQYVNYIVVELPKGTFIVGTCIESVPGFEEGAAWINAPESSNHCVSLQHSRLVLG